MAPTREDILKKSLSTILDLIQMLKYNLEDFKSLEMHKDLRKQELRADAATLLRAIDAYLMRLRSSLGTEVFSSLSEMMHRDRLHDLTLHMEVAVVIENISDYTAELESIVNNLRSQAANSDKS